MRLERTLTTTFASRRREELLQHPSKRSKPTHKKSNEQIEAEERESERAVEEARKVHNHESGYGSALDGLFGVDMSSGPRDEGGIVSTTDTTVGSAALAPSDQEHDNIRSHALNAYEAVLKSRNEQGAASKQNEEDQYNELEDHELLAASADTYKAFGYSREQFESWTSFKMPVSREELADWQEEKKKRSFRSKVRDHVG